MQQVATQPKPAAISQPAALRGVIAPVLTPFNDDLTVAEDLFIAHCKWLLTPEGGCVGLAPFGTTSEALSLSLAERKTLLDALVGAGIDPAVLVPGVGLPNAPDTAHLIRHAVDLGCHGVMCLPPFYYKNVGDDGIYGYFAYLLELVGRADAKIYLYHIPQMAGVGIPVPVVARLVKDFPQVVGIKDSTGDWKNTSALLDIEGLAVYPGSETLLLEAMGKGGPGCISATANLNGAAIGEIVTLYDSGDVATAKEKHKRVEALRHALFDYAFIEGQKALMARWRGDARWGNLRPPLVAMARSEVDALEAKLKNEFGVTGG